MPKEKIQTIYHIGILIFISYCTIFANNEIPNLDIMEIRNIVTAREMVSDNNWLIPTMNGEIRIAKPPLPTWLTALPIIATHSDDNLRALRFPAGVAAIFMVFFVYFVAKALFNSPLVSLFSASVLASSEFLILMGKRASWDIFCHSFMLGAICLLLFGWKEEKKSLGLFVIAGILMGLSFLSKGPISFHSLLLPFLMSSIYAFGYKTITLKWRETSIALLVCSVIAALWPFYLYQYLPDAAVTIGAKEMHTWVDYKAKSIWYYLPFPIHSGVWVCLCISALSYPLFSKNKYLIEEKKNYKFLVSWILLTVILLTLVPKKSTHYLLPVVIPMSLVIGQFMQHLLTVYNERKQTSSERIIISIQGTIVILLALLSLVACLYFDFWVHPELPINYIPLIAFVALFLLSYSFYKKVEIMKLFTTTLVLVCSICFFIPPIISPMIKQKSYMALKVAREETQGQKVPIYSSYEMGIKEIWSVGRKVETKDIGSLEATLESFEYFSKEDPNVIFHDKPLLSKRLQSVKSYVDSNSNKTWFLSLVDGK